ncbi:CDP-alcohol phosphatidyltransferase family protein [Konateibacter massiliensis]|uniref:CDP-alcohol phosphatidyltransferase family protein n=1 Tax=Konateibacter massiliensis TaxID=2002841 RepID=UPI000C1486DD|nr:CDP-alcohol phosphatidyltransferase family protein [Konateibacter massiliensis]
MNNLPNVISVIRIILSICLLLSEPFKTQFWCIYIICGLSDMADGYLARKLKAVSKIGAILDSLGDLVFAVIITILVLWHIPVPAWGFIWVGAIVVIKLLSILIGYLKFQAFTALHTYANKAVGLLLFIILPIYTITNSGMIMVFLLVAATLAALEELLIVIKSKSLERNIKGIFQYDSTK